MKHDDPEKAQDPITVEYFRHLVDLGHASQLRPVTFDCSLDQDDVTRRIRQCFPARVLKYDHQLKRLSDGLLIEHLINRKPLRPYRGIAQIIRDSLRTDRNGESDSKSVNWPEAVDLALRAHSLREKWDEDEVPICLYESPTPQTLAKAAIWMRDKGYPLVIENGYPVFEESDRKRMVRYIESLIQKIGPINVIDRVILHLARNRHEGMERYLSPHHFVQIKDSDVKFPFPSNYLIQLAVKNIDSTAKKSISSDDWKELCEFAQMFAAIHDLWRYGQFETVFKYVFSVCVFITDLALCDRFFSPKQLRRSYVPIWIDCLFDWFDYRFQKINGWSIFTAKRVAEIILESARKTGPTLLKRRDIVAKCLIAGLEPDEVMNVLPIFCHPSRPNPDLTLPYFPKSINFWRHPLISLDREQILLIDAALCGYAFYESIAAALRPWDKEFQFTQKNIGQAAERFLQSHLVANGISAYCGKYKIGDETFECDCVLETEKHVIFIEQKAKVLTEGAQIGVDLDILIDLLGSFFDSISQCYRHEIHLREKGEIILLMPGGEQKKIELKGRSIEKIAASLLDFGRFNDRSVIMQLLEIYPYVIVAPLNGSDPDKVERFNKKTDTIRRQLERISEIATSNDREDPIFSSWFLSLQQLMIIAEGSNSNECFANRLWKTRHLSTLSNDWYTETAFQERLQSHA